MPFTQRKATVVKLPQFKLPSIHVISAHLSLLPLVFFVVSYISLLSATPSNSKISDSSMIIIVPIKQYDRLILLCVQVRISYCKLEMGTFKSQRCTNKAFSNPLWMHNLKLRSFEWFLYEQSSVENLRFPGRPNMVYRSIHFFIE